MTTRTLLALAATTAAACGSARPAPVPPPTPALDPVPRPALPATMSAAFSPVGFLLGDWHEATSDLTEHWVAAAGTLYGVRFGGAGAWGVVIIDDGDGKADTADGNRRMIDLGDGHSELELPELAATGRVRFGLDGFTVDYRVDAGGRLVVEVSATMRGEHDEFRTELVGRSGYAVPSTDRLWLAPATDPAAPALEAADRAFAADTEASDVAGWVKWFAPDGVLWRDERIEGAAAIGARVKKTLEGGSLAWEPIASRMHGDALGFTVGTATWTENGKTTPDWRGSYVTIWRKQPDGTWKVAFDAGRAEQPARPTN